MVGIDPLDAAKRKDRGALPAVSIRRARSTSAAHVAAALRDDIAEAAVVRQALEGVTVEAAASAGAAHRLDEAIDRQRAAAAREDTRAFHEADEAFHEALAAGAGYPGIWRLLRSVKVQIDRARRLTLPAPGRMRQVIGEHVLIRDAVASGDVAGARAAMKAHLDVVIPDVVLLRGRHPGYFV